jgi:exodeoxyribonuclease-3
MKLATWNINGIKARLDVTLRWLQDASPDVVCLQEIKSVDEGFPREAFADLGYQIEVHGQKSFNGVALLSKYPLSDVRRGLPGDDEDTQARFIEALVEGPRVVRFTGIYLPNGNPIGTEKFTYKLAWMERFHAHVAERLADEEAMILAGDYNVIPTPCDAKRPTAWVQDALYQPESRASYQRLVNLGLTDAIRATHDDAQVFTFWDYQAGCWPKDDGIRIDHMLLSPQAADRLQRAGIDRHVRGWEKPSDHVPVWIELN